MTKRERQKQEQLLAQRQARIQAYSDFKQWAQIELADHAIKNGLRAFPIDMILHVYRQFEKKHPIPKE